MFNDFCTMFFGSSYTPNDFDLAFALIFFMLVFHGISGLIATLKNGVK